jgi:hypothetical protein
MPFARRIADGRERRMKAVWKRSSVMALLSGGAALLVGATLVFQANAGVAPALALPALMFLFTVGPPALLGVACVGAVWGRVAGMVGFALFAPCAASVAVWCVLVCYIRSGRRLGVGGGPG